jgi:hypothetical protein
MVGLDRDLMKIIHNFSFMKSGVGLIGLIAICIVISSFKKPLSEFDERLILLAVINDEIVFHGNDPMSLLGQCVELKIDTINLDFYSEYVNVESGAKAILYDDVLIGKHQIFEKAMLPYLQSLKIDKIAIDAPRAAIIEIDMVGNCIRGDRASSYIQEQHEFCNEYNKKAKITFFVKEVVNGKGQKVDINLNLIRYKISTGTGIKK